MVVMSCEHAGLAVAFRDLENEMNRVLCEVEDPRRVREYLKDLLQCSKVWDAENRYAGRNK